MLITFRMCTTNYITNTLSVERREAGLEGIVRQEVGIRNHLETMRDYHVFCLSIFSLSVQRKIVFSTAYLLHQSNKLLLF